MNNQILEELTERRSVRAYEETGITMEERSAIITAAAMAPTAGCQQLYTILDVTDEALKQQLAELCDHQPFIARAKLLLVFCADCKKWYDAFSAAGCSPRKPGAGDLLLAVDDALIAAQNAVTAAQSLGIGSCYIGDVMETASRCEMPCICPSMYFLPPLWSSAVPPNNRKTEKNRSVSTRNIWSMKILTMPCQTGSCQTCSLTKPAKKSTGHGFLLSARGNTIPIFRRR